jgi:glycosyl hydrolase family 42 (putative beta-galactosidase)
MNRRESLRALAAVPAARLLRAAEGGVSVKPGWDWSLPESVRPVPYSGFITWGKTRFSDMITVRGVSASWRMLCPAPDQYDWKPLDDAMAEARASGMRIGLHVKGVERPSVPDWVIEKYRVPVLDVIPLQENQPWRLQIVPPWNADVRREYVKFMEAFARTGIPQRDEVVYGYIHGISPSRGEELFLRAVDIDDWEKKAGLTPELLGACLKSRLEAMLRAFHGVEHKLAWMTGGPLAVGQKGHEEYMRQTADLTEYAIAHGTGWRSGGIDFQHMLFTTPVLGASITPEGHSVIDESLPIHDGRHFVGDENEEYGKYWEWRFGPYERHAYRHRIASLRGLQLGENFQMVSPETLKLNPDLNRYVLLAQGRHAANSPDAWAYLRECAIRTAQGPRVVKNVERWLVQRDIDGHRSVACERVDRHPLSMDPPDRHYDMDARRTDIRNGQKGLAFQLDAKFWKRAEPALVKVTYTDRERAAWHVAYGQKQTSPQVQSAGDGERKTATFEIAGLSGDFRIVTAGPGDVTVTMVRVIK